ncbi:hypothetical protein HYFRA_00010968 [Hymenoscyphus fraxineus]|uniref:Uncharacterized protein n=1 Tax=Hymenoscyphus fraxineus TaxID=746836 RepID=A0A9N9PVL3_9HELO|nr:hypothetical protein HYFRA_00010968 [Hymenoscyphus fraxineus]
MSDTSKTWDIREITRLLYRVKFKDKLKRHNTALEASQPGFTKPIGEMAMYVRNFQRLGMISNPSSEQENTTSMRERIYSCASYIHTEESEDSLQQKWQELDGRAKSLDEEYPRRVAGVAAGDYSNFSNMGPACQSIGAEDPRTDPHIAATTFPPPNPGPLPRYPYVNPHVLASRYATAQGSGSGSGSASGSSDPDGLYSESPVATWEELRTGKQGSGGETDRGEASGSKK